MKGGSKNERRLKMKEIKMKGGKKLCLNVNDLRAIAQVNKIALKLKEMERLLKIRKDERNERKKRIYF